jgi:hypothetical protein
VRKSAAELALESGKAAINDIFATALECPNCHYKFVTNKLLAGEYNSPKPPKKFGFWIAIAILVLALIFYNALQ